MFDSGGQPLGALALGRLSDQLGRFDEAADDLMRIDRIRALEQLGDKRVGAETRKLGYRLDPRGYLDRVRGAVKDRRVSVRPAPDTMSRLTGLLPVAQGVATYAALCREAGTRIAAGDRRGRGQIMADTLVQRVTGQVDAKDVSVEVNLVMTDTALLGTAASDTTLLGTAASNDVAGADEPAHLDGYGLGQRRFLRIRDQVCRTPPPDRAPLPKPRSGATGQPESTCAGRLRRLVVARIRLAGKDLVPLRAALAAPVSSHPAPGRSPG